MKKGRIAIAAIVLGALFAFSGCSAMHTAISKRNLDVQTKMSDTIFLEPVSLNKRVVYFDMRNTSSEDLNVKDSIANIFRSKGYKITNDPDKATYMLQGNTLKVSKVDKREARSLLRSGFGSAITGGALAGGASYALGGSTRTSLGIGLAGAALGFVGDALVKDNVYVMITDLQIRERPLAGETVTQKQSAALSAGSSTNMTQQSSGVKVKWKTYRTRIISTAEKMNLDFKEARPALEGQLVRSISGVF